MKIYVLVWSKNELYESVARMKKDFPSAHVIITHGGDAPDERAKYARIFKEHEGDAIFAATYESMCFGGFDLGVVDEILTLGNADRSDARVIQAMHRATLRKDSPS